LEGLIRLLAISAKGAEPADTPRERADLRLMAQAAERAANAHGGSLTLGADEVTFRLPLPPGHLRHRSGSD
jgi:hypothetical protein